jgi:hypothetical protein
MALAFISYRQEDSEYAAQALYMQLKVRFGSGQLFMDRNSMSAGSKWPMHIQQSVEQATGLLAICGSRWLMAVDEWGRRRLDEPDDRVDTARLRCLVINEALTKQVRAGMALGRNLNCPQAETRVSGRRRLHLGAPRPRRSVAVR